MESKPIPKFQLLMPPEQLGPPGVEREFRLHDPTLAPDPRPIEQRAADTAEREFELRCILGQSLDGLDQIGFAHSSAAGASLLRVPPGTNQAELCTPSGHKFRIVANGKGELSLLVFHCRARSYDEARTTLSREAHLVLDWLAYRFNVPIYVKRIVTWDRTNGLFYSTFRTPHGAVSLPESFEWIVHESLRPVYALYREGLTNPSPFYKFLCFYKVLEGVFGPLRTQTIGLAKDRSVKLKFEKCLVPEHKYLAGEVAQFVGQPIKQVYDKHLQHEFRNGIAHFSPDETSKAFVMSDYLISTRLRENVVLAEICAREAIRAEQALLDQIARPAVAPRVDAPHGGPP